MSRRIGEQGGAIEDQAHLVRVVCDAYGWDDWAGLIDEIEARFRRALALAEKNELHEGVCIWLNHLDWIVKHGPALKGKL